MTSTRIAKEYGQLTPAERLPLLFAADARGDELEYQRLMDSAPREAWRVPHHLGLNLAFSEVAQLHYMEMLSGAGYYLHCLDLAESMRGKAGKRAFDVALMFGYLLNAQLAGWRAFCRGLHIDPDVFQALLPGQGLLDMAARLAEDGAFTPEGALEYVRRRDKAGMAIVSADGVAAALRRAYEARAEWWG
jgi:hypothetical protein